VCTSPALEAPGNLSILVRVDVSSTLSGSVSIAYEIVTPDGRHITGDPAIATVTTADSLGNPVFAAVDQGGLALAGNTLMTCPASTVCTAAQDGGAGDNNNFNMQYVDVDGVAATFNSSRSTLDLPAGAQILYAGLRWSGDSGQTSRGDRLKVQFTDPLGSTSPVSAQTIVALDSQRFISMADVTDLVTVGGAGSYTVADVAASLGENKYAGWALVVAYRSPSSPTRMLLIRDTSQADPWTIQNDTMSATIAGLPPVVTGRAATVGVVAFEGDKGLTGDTLTANGLALTDAQNPANNVFNSSILVGLGRDPTWSNSFGVDVDRFDTTVPVRIDRPADATTVTFTFATTGDQVYLATIVLVIDLAP
jgi:hypothetical protein